MDAHDMGSSGWPGKAENEMGVLQGSQWPEGLFVIENIYDSNQSGRWAWIISR